MPEKSKDKIVPDEAVLQILLKIFQALFVNDLSRQTFLLNLLPKVKSKYVDLQIETPKAIGQIIFNPEEVLFHTLGFSISRRQSSLVSAGTGVFVTKGFVPKGAVVAMYPGIDIIYFLKGLGKV